MILIIIIVLVILTRIKVKIHYQREYDNDKLVVKLTAWFGLIHYTINIPAITLDTDSLSVKVKESQGTSDQTKMKQNKEFTPEDLIANFKSMRMLLKQVIGFHKIVRRFLKRVQVKQFEWHSLLGLGDAAHTGVLIGSCWTIKGSIIGLLTMSLHFQKMPSYTITPDFQNERFETDFFCILYFRVGQAIMTGIKLLRYWKGSKMKLLSGTFAEHTSNSNKHSM